MHLQIVNFILLVSQYFCDNRNEIIQKKTKPNSYMTKTNKKVANSVFYFLLFGISITNLRKMFFILSQAWDKEKILSPHEESNLRLSDLHSNALPLSHRDSKVS